VRTPWLLAVLALWACDERLDSGDGRTLYVAVCARCHGVDGRGDPIEKQRLGVPDMTDPKWQAARKDDDIHRTIVEGSPSKKMPAFGTTSFRPEQIAALVRYVRELGGR
jgi:mono/diheme cytochrome c family protein